MMVLTMILVGIQVMVKHYVMQVTAMMITMVHLMMLTGKILIQINVLMMMVIHVMTVLQVLIIHLMMDGIMI